MEQSGLQNVVVLKLSLKIYVWKMLFLVQPHSHQQSQEGWLGGLIQFEINLSSLSAKFSLIPQR